MVNKKRSAQSHSQPILRWSCTNAVAFYFLNAKMTQMPQTKSGLSVNLSKMLPALRRILPLVKKENADLIVMNIHGKDDARSHHDRHHCGDNCPRRCGARANGFPQWPLGSGAGEWQEKPLEVASSIVSLSSIVLLPRTRSHLRAPKQYMWPHH